MKLFNFLKSYSFLSRLVFSAFFIFCIPLLVVAWIFLDQAFARVSEQESMRHLQAAGQFSDYFHAQRTDMVSIAARIGYEKKITLPELRSDKYNEVEAIKTLSHYCELSGIAKYCYLYFRGSDFIIGSNAKYDRDVFLSQRVNYAANERMREEIVFALDEAAGIISFSSFPDTEHNTAKMFFCVPISVFRENDAVVIFVIDRLSLEDSFLGDLNSGEYELYIFDAEDTLLLSNNTSLYPAIASGELESLLNDRPSFSGAVSINGEERRLYMIKDEQSSFSFVILPSSSTVGSDVAAFLRTMHIVIILLAVLMLLLLAAFAYINYKPMLRTIRKIRVYDDESGDPSGELESIEHAFDKKIRENNAMLSQFAEQQFQLIDYTILGILSGKSPSDEELLRCSLDPEHRYFFVMTALGAKLDVDNDAELRNAAADPFCANLCTVDHPDQRVTLLVSLPEPELRVPIAEAVFKVLAGDAPEGVTLGVGTVESSRAQIYSSSLNSVIAAGSASRDGIVYFEEIIAVENKPELYPAEATLHFYQFIRQGDFESAMREFDTVTDSLAGIRSQILEHYVCYDVLQSFLKTLHELSIELSPDEKSRLLAFNDYDELRANVAAVAEPACLEIRERRRTFNLSKMGRIVDYIDENVSDPDLGLPMIAAHFGISMSSLSTNFNETMGRGLREYIVEKRIENAKALLASGNHMSVKEVALSVGFRDVSYFIKLFKSSTGVTPGSYAESK